MKSLKSLIKAVYNKSIDRDIKFYMLHVLRFRDIDNLRDRKYKIYMIIYEIIYKIKLITRRG